MRFTIAITVDSFSHMNNYAMMNLSWTSYLIIAAKLPRLKAKYHLFIIVEEAVFWSVLF